ncbi:MAG: hypothetical protein ACYDH6_23945 [Acidimicrobiales bacterium]
MTETQTLRPDRGHATAGPGEARPPQARRRISLVALGGGAIVVIIGAHLALAAFMRVPIIQPDELGYLQNARFLARGGPRSETEYYPGFSLLLVPLWWFSTSPNIAFHGALVIEALLAGGGAVLVWRLTALLAPGLLGWRRALAVLVTLAYPSALLYGNFALAEVTFATVFTGVVLLAAKAFTRKSPAWCAALGVASGALAMVHPRGFAVVVAVGIFGVVVLGLHRRSIAALAALTLGSAVSLAAARWLVTLTKGRVAPRFGAYRPDSVLSKNLSVHGALSLFSELAGQLWYLSLATAGLVPLALLIGGRALVKVAKGDRSASLMAQAFATLSFLGVWALSALFMNLGDRADKLIYGRYNEGVIIPLLIIALADLLKQRPNRHFRTSHDRTAVRRWLTTSVVAIVACGSVLYLGHTRGQLHGALNPANVLSLASMLTRMGTHIHVIAMSGVVLGVIAVLVVVAWRLPAVAVLALVGMFSWSAIDLQTRYLVPGTEARGDQDDIATALSALAKVPGADLSCVAWETDRTVDYNYYNDRFLVPGQKFVQYDPTTPPGPCGPLVVSTRGDFATRFPGARIITSENFVAQTLWAVPRPADPTFNVLDSGGWLSPPTTTLGAAVAMAAAQLHGSRIDLPGGDAVTLASGKTSPLRVVVHHAPGGAPWPSVAALHSGSGQFAVQLALSVVGGDGPSNTFNLPETLLPGQNTRLTVPLTAVDASGRPLAPGTYTIHLGLLQQSVGSFDDPGATIALTVRAPR